MKYTSKFARYLDSVDNTEADIFEDTNYTGDFVKDSWGNEPYSYPNQIGAIKKCYRYLTGGDKGLNHFIRELEAIPSVRYAESSKTNRVLYRSDAVFDLFRTYETTGAILKKRRIHSLEELVFAMENSEN